MPSTRLELPGCTLIENAPLLARNTLRVAARSAWLAEVHDAAALPDLLARPALRALPLLTLGDGSNVLFTADWPGLIVQLRDAGIAQLGESDGRVRLRVRNRNTASATCTARGSATPIAASSSRMPA